MKRVTIRVRARPAVDSELTAVASSACPEASAGPHDSSYLFEEFRRLMG